MKLHDQLILHEALKLRLYKCTANKWTIGVGRNLEGNPLTFTEREFVFGSPPPKPDQVIPLLRVSGITREQALYLLDNDIATATADARSLLGATEFDKLSEQRKFVLIDMAFNMGKTVFSQFRNTLALIRSGNYAKASENMLQSRWAKQVGSRSQRLAKMMKDNLYHDQTQI